jgi:chaperone modulatory protein CbpM
MPTEQDVLARVESLTITRLRVWVREGLIKPADKTAQTYSETDIARAALIQTLEDDLGFDAEDVPVLLSLIDQIHGLRSELRGVLEALDELPQEARSTVRMCIEQRRKG